MGLSLISFTIAGMYSGTDFPVKNSHAWCLCESVRWFGVGVCVRSFGLVLVLVFV